MDANDLGYLIKRVQQALRNAIDPALSGLGLTTAQYAALYNLRRHPGASNAELARLSFVTPQTMVRIVADLERRGLLARVSSPSHGVVLEGRLTDQGADALRSAQERVDAILSGMLEGIHARDVEKLGAWLTDMASRLEEGRPASDRRAARVGGRTPAARR